MLLATEDFTILDIKNKKRYGEILQNPEHEGERKEDER